MAGLTLVYCLWIDPSEIFDTMTSNGIQDCSIVLFVIAERITAAKKYRNAFEVIRQRVLDKISAMEPGERRSRETMPGLTADLAEYRFDGAACAGANAQFDVDGGSLEQVSHILGDMTGEDIAQYGTQIGAYPTLVPYADLSGSFENPSIETFAVEGRLGAFFL
jgi:hypothetical protein